MKKTTIFLILFVCVIAVCSFAIASTIEPKQGEKGGAKSKELCCDKSKALTLCGPGGGNPGDIVCFQDGVGYSLPTDTDGDGDLECGRNQNTINIKGSEDACDYAELVLKHPECPDDPDCIAGPKSETIDQTLYCCTVKKAVECTEKNK